MRLFNVLFLFNLLLCELFALNIRLSNNKKVNKKIHNYSQKESMHSKINSEGKMIEKTILRDIIAGLVITYESTLNTSINYEFLELYDNERYDDYVMGICIYEKNKKIWKMKSIIIDPVIYYNNTNEYCKLLKKFYKMIKKRCKNESKVLDNDCLSDFVKLEVMF